jgi:hypothetical protein
MLLAPFERLTIETPLRPEEARQRVAEVIEPRRMFRFFSGNHKPYQGELNDYRFEVTRIIHYRNSFLPVIKGEIRPGLGGSVIDITMHPHIFVIVFMMIWFGIAGSIFFGMFCTVLVTIWESKGENIEGLLGLLLPMGFLMFGYLLVMGGFKFEAVKSKTFFQELFRI